MLLRLLGCLSTLGVLSILSICPTQVSSCHYTLVIIQNGTKLNSTGWIRNGNGGNSPFGKPTPPPSGLKEDQDNPIFIPNWDQDCVCGGQGMDRALGGSGSPQNVNKTGGELDASKNGTEKNATSPEDDPNASLTNAKELGINSTEGYRYFLAKIIINKADGSKLVCSGTLINAKFILTAAHCVCDTFLTCGNKNGNTASDILTNFDPQANDTSPGMEIFIGFNKDETTPVTGPYLAEIIIVHPNYKQENELIGTYDVALIEMKDFVNRSSLIQPICLPPNQASDQSFVDLDCWVSSSQNPVPFFSLAQDMLVCPPEKQYSFLDGFEDITNGSVQECQTNVYGQVTGQKCQSECRNDSAYFTTDCEELWKKAKNEKDFKNAYKYSNGKITCYPKIEDFNSATDLKQSHRFKNGWCDACPAGSKASKCELQRGNSTKICCINQDSKEILMEWGFCSSSCGKTQSEAGPEEVNFHEAAGQTFPKTTANENVCQVQEHEFCTGSDTGPLITAKFDENNVFQKYAITALRNESNTKFTTSCFGDVGGPVWKKGVFLSLNKKNAFPLQVLTGVISRHENRCKKEQGSNIDVSIHTRIKNILPWILEKSIRGRCRDVKLYQTTLQNIANRQIPVKKNDG